MTSQELLDQYVARGIYLRVSIRHKGLWCHLLRGNNGPLYGYATTGPDGEVVEDYGELDFDRHGELIVAFAPAMVEYFRQRIQAARRSGNAEA